MAGIKTGIRIFLTTDLHLGHTGLADRPEDFSERILDRLGMNLNPSDILICLGDICWKDFDLWHERLSFISCKKWLVLGNHDNKSITWYLSHGWDMVCESFTMKIFGKVILFSHKPQKDTGEYNLNIHGHFHSFGLARVKETEPDIYKILTEKHVLISLESNHYEPVKLQRVIEQHIK